MVGGGGEDKVFGWLAEGGEDKSVWGVGWGQVIGVF